jgi:hypothetical protein
MALLFMDGFAGGDMATKWSSSSNASNTNTSPRVTGGSYMFTGGSNGNVTKTFTAKTEIFMGCGTRGSSGVWYIFLYGDTGATTHLTIMRNGTSGFMELRLGNQGTLLATGTTFIPYTSWHYIEIRATVADSGGICQVRLDGQTVNEIDYTGDTKNGGTNTSIDAFTLYASATANYTDVYFLDTTGTANNSWLGDVTVRTILPSGNGNYSQLTGSDADQVNNYQLVDESPASSTDYVGSPTVGLKDSYLLSDLPAGVTQIKALQSNIYAAKSDATLASSKVLLRTGGTDYYGNTQGMGTSFQTYSQIFALNPNTAIAWTVADINGLEAGIEVA